MKTPLFIILSIVAIVIIILYILMSNGTNNISDSVQSSVFNQNEQQENVGSSLQISDEKIGEGDAVKIGDTVSVNYKGTLEDGTEFDNSYKRGEPFSFTVGEGYVIQGWEQGLIGMKVGGKRKLVIPPELGYGSVGAGDVIPPNATLIFEIELMKLN